MKSEDLLKAIGNIDDKFIEEAAPKINAVNETNTAESNDSAKTDDKKLVEIVKVKSVRSEEHTSELQSPR